MSFDDVQPCPGWLETVRWFRRHNQDRQHFKFWMFTVIYTWNTAIYYFYWTISLVAKKKKKKRGGHKFRRYSRSCHRLIIQALTVTFTLKTASESVFTTLLLKVVYCHTQYGYKSLSSSEDIVWTNINSIVKCSLWPWPWTQQSSIFTGNFDLR